MQAVEQVMIQIRRFYFFSKFLIHLACIADKKILLLVSLTNYWCLLPGFEFRTRQFGPRYIIRRFCVVFVKRVNNSVLA